MRSAITQTCCSPIHQLWRLWKRVMAAPANVFVGCHATITTDNCCSLQHTPSGAACPLTAWRQSMSPPGLCRLCAAVTQPALAHTLVCGLALPVAGVQRQAV